MKIGCVLVLYNPDIQLTKKVIDSIIIQVDFVFIVDNSIQNYDINYLIEQNKESINYMRLNQNVGIAKAQNIALEYLIKNGFSYVFFIDQDSIIESDLVSILLKDLIRLQSSNILVGAIGPRPINNRNKKKYVGSIIKGKRLIDDITEVSAIINSGSLIPTENFQINGLMDEELFIDGVDHEWCWRGANKLNLRFFISERANLYHHLGEKDHFFIYRNIALTSSFRIYYQYRNYFYLVKRDYVPLYWKVSNGIKYFIKIFYYPVFVKPHYQFLKQIVRGMKDGILFKG